MARDGSSHEDLDRGLAAAALASALGAAPAVAAPVTVDVRTAVAMRRCLALLCAAALVGCGAGAGEGEAPDGVALTVTRDFGTRDVASAVAPEVAGSDTVLRLLQRNARVTTRAGGELVRSIEGVSGGRRAGRPVDWSFYVNGIEADEGAADTRVRPGDRVWWDHHDRGTARSVPAVVGSFPEPFVSGVEGRRLPVRLACAEPQSAACDTVARRLTDLGVVAARAGLRLPEVEETLRVVIGPWPALRGTDRAAAQLAAGPRASGVFARFDAAGRELSILTPQGRTARTLGAGAGLVAATAVEGQAPTWFVTGTDAAGVESAARAFDESALNRKFALAIADDRAVTVPEVAAPR